MNVIDRFGQLYAELCQTSPEDLASIYSEDVIFIDPIKSHRGLESVKVYFANLLAQSKSCRFDIANVVKTEPSDADITHMVNWTMYLTLTKSESVIVLNGTSQLTVRDDLITYHRDYYDLGEMVYEHIPILRFFIKKIKARLAR